MFVKILHQHPVHTTLTNCYIALDSAVVEAETAIRARLQAHSELVQPAQVSTKRRKTSPAELAQQRAYAFSAATLRQHAAFEPLCVAIEFIHSALEKARSLLTDTNPYEELGTTWLVDALNLNIIESIKLYKRAFSTLGRFGDADLEWTLGTMLLQLREKEEQWLDGVPKLPARKNISDIDRGPDLPAIFLARVLTMMERIGEGGGCISIDRHNMIADFVAGLLRSKGWDAFLQCNTGEMTPGLQCNAPRGAKKKRKS